MAEKEQPKLYTHYFECLNKLKHRFSIETEEANNSKIEFDKMRCPMCQSKIQLDPSMLGVGGSSMASQGRLNMEASLMAMKMAAERKRMDGNDKMITVNPPAGERGRPVQVPERVLKSLEEKITPELGGLLEE